MTRHDAFPCWVTSSSRAEADVPPVKRLTLRRPFLLGFAVGIVMFGAMARYGTPPPTEGATQIHDAQELQWPTTGMRDV